MGNSFGKMLKVTVFGQSHSVAIGTIIDGLPAGIKLDIDKINVFMQRRISKSSFTTKRVETDNFEILSGLVDNITCGTAICAIIKNNDAKSKDYDKIKDNPRPMHADYPAYCKYQGFNDIRGGGQFSGRMTACICFAGAVAEQLLEHYGIFAVSHISSIGDIYDDKFCDININKNLIKKLKTDSFPVINEIIKAEMFDYIKEIHSKGDSIGGTIETAICGVPVGVGEPIFDSVESKISSAMFGIPAVKGIGFGDGFNSSKILGLQYNDEFYVDSNGDIKTKTNRHGGILGGISTGMPIIYNVAIKPTPSIAIPQNTVSLKNKTNEILRIEGRHDSCIVPRAVPSVEAIGLLTIADLLLENRKDNIINEFE